MRVLITGGCGFVGSSLARQFVNFAGVKEVVVFDNLRRRGSEINIAPLKDLGCDFVHGDVRIQDDLMALTGNFDILIEASADPSVLGGLNGAPTYLLQTNLGGTLNCLEFARKHCGMVLFLSTSRVYSIAPLRKIGLKEGSTSFERIKDDNLPGLSAEGITEDFPTNQPRSLYGASKLCSEIVIQEYVETYGVKAIVNRCGVLAGAGQFGKVDQGVFTMWVANHLFGYPLKYFGYGGTGKQVRDLLHPTDLFALLTKQVETISEHSGEVFNVGGGQNGALSLLELTALCREITGREVEVQGVQETSTVDIPYYVSDHTKASRNFRWSPRISPKEIITDIYQWIQRNRPILETVFSRKEGE